MTLIFALTFKPVLASEIKLDASFRELNLGQQLEYQSFIQGQVVNPETLLVKEDGWQRVKHGTPNFGMTSDQYWFRIHLTNLEVYTLPLTLQLDYALLDYIEVYLYQEGSLVRSYVTGDLLPFSQRPVLYPSFLFPLELASKRDHVLLIKVQTQGAMKVPMHLWQPEAFIKQSQSFMQIHGVFIGIMLIMSFYNLFLYYSIREPSYLFYSLFTLFILLTISSFNGFTYQRLWPEAVSFNQKAPIILNGLGSYFLVAFSYYFFPLEQFPKIKTSMKLLLAISLTVALSTFFIPYILSTRIQAFQTILLAVLTLGIGVYMMQQGIKMARLFVVAWGVFLVGVFSSALSIFGILPHNFFTYYSSSIGAVFAVLALSLALADRINVERRGKEKAQLQAIEHLENFQRLYENALEGIFILDAHGHFESANPRLLDILGFESLEALKEFGNALQRYLINPEDFVTLMAELDKKEIVVDFEIALENRYGKELWVSVSVRKNRDIKTGTVNIEGSLIDISQRKLSERKLSFLASHDPLTQLYNRREFELRLHEYSEKTKNGRFVFSVLYIDLDQFKLVNDTCGHTAGDQLLIQITQRMQRHLSSEQVLARLGGDEFAVLVAEDRDFSYKVAEQIRKTIEGFHYTYKSRRFTLGVSIGLVEVDNPFLNVQAILSMADTACFMAKDEGRNRIRIYTDDDEAIKFRQREMDWVSTLTEAIEQDQFVLFGQKISANDHLRHGAHYEVLLRMKGLDGQLISPVSFLPAAERYNMATVIDRWVISHFFHWLNENPKHLDELDVASINLSGASIGDRIFDQFLQEIIAETNIPPHKICFEITESMAITNLGNTTDFISRYKAMGYRFALDDFGTGFSSYAYLKELGVDYVKIDGIFVKDIIHDKVGLAMVKSIYEVSQVLDIQCVAEFVEDDLILGKLSEIGIQYSQGYAIHKPCPLDELI